MIRTIKITRSGNLLTVPHSPVIENALTKELVYKHRKFYEGPELRARKEALRRNPELNFNPKFDVETRTLFDVLDGNIYCFAGGLDRISKILRKEGFNVEYTDLRENLLPPADYDRLLRIPDFDFRYKQDEVLFAIDKYDGGLIGAPTGFGKTMLIVMLGLIYPKSEIVVFTPGLDLIHSTYRRLTAHMPGEVGRIGDGIYEHRKRISLVSIDSAHKVNLTNTQLILADEVHEMATDHRTEVLCSQYTDAKWFGFSGSLDMRADGGDAKLEVIFGPKRVDIGYGEAQQAGVVVPIELQMYHVPGDVTSPTIQSNWPTFLKKRQAYWAHDHRNRTISQAVDRTRKDLTQSTGLKDPQTLVMVATVEHAVRLRQFMPGYTLVYGNMDPKLRRKLIDEQLLDEEEYMDIKRRKYLLNEFEAGRLTKVIATQCWKKGIDPVHLRVFCRADGETSAINSIQLPGRLSRIMDGKDKGMLVDFDDAWDKWAQDRASKRRSQYKKNGFWVNRKSLQPSLSLALNSGD